MNLLSWSSSDSCHVIFLKGVFSFVRWGFLLFGVVCDAVIPWILVMILSIGFPFGLDGSVLYNYKITILNVYSMMKTISLCSVIL